MTIIQRLQLRTGETDTELLADLVESAKEAILSRRFPFGEYPTRTVEVDGQEIEETYVESRYQDLQFRIALDLYNKIGAEGQLRHDENGIDRTYESSWISAQLLNEVTPYLGVPTT